jgi:hypothetical protein
VKAAECTKGDKMKSFRTNPQNAIDADAIAALLDATADGATLSWLEIEQKTGVKMNYRGKDLVRRVIRRADRAHASIPGSGIRLSCPESSVEIVENAVHRIVGAMGTASRTTRVVLDRHGKDMSDEDRQKLIRVHGTLGAVKALTNDSVRMLLPATKDAAE